VEHPTVAQALEEGAGRLAAVGLEHPRREAARLWARLAGATVGDVWLAREVEAPRERRARFLDAVERRAEGEPAAYATGVGGFRTLELQIDSRVLIPRPETEGLVERVLAWGRRARGRGAGAWGDALDVGTGSGCIALSLAVEGRFRRVVAADASTEVLALARENLRRVAPPVPVEFREGDLLEAVAGEAFEVIVANPPYVTAEEFEGLDIGVRRFEPRDALVSGEGGLEHTRRLLEQAAPHLRADGLLAVEIDCSRAQEAESLARSAGWHSVRVEQDLFGRDRYLLASRETSP
jgi:release factor glutamine methyltransferase